MMRAKPMLLMSLDIQDIRGAGRTDERDAGHGKRERTQAIYCPTSEVSPAPVFCLF